MHLKYNIQTLIPDIAKIEKDNNFPASDIRIETPTWQVEMVPLCQSVVAANHTCMTETTPYSLFLS